MVTKEEGTEFANSIGAIFEFTSASSNLGINELFNKLGTKLLDQIQGKEENQQKGVRLKTENDKNNKESKCC